MLKCILLNITFQTSLQSVSILSVTHTAHCCHLLPLSVLSQAMTEKWQVAAVCVRACSASRGTDGLQDMQLLITQFPQPFGQSPAWQRGDIGSNPDTSMTLMVDKVALEQVFLPVSRLCPVSTMPPTLHTQSLLPLPCNIIS